MSGEAELTFKITAQNAQALVSLENLLRKQNEIEASFGKIGQTSKATAKEYEAFVKNVQRLNETPTDKFERAQQQHHRTLGMLNRALQDGAINYRTFTNEAEKSAAAMKAVDPASLERLAKHNELLRQGADAHSARAAEQVAGEAKLRGALEQTLNTQKMSAELVSAFKKHEIELSDQYKRALIAEGQVDLKIAQQKRGEIENYKRALIGEAQLDLKLAQDKRQRDDADFKRRSAAVTAEHRNWQQLRNEVQRLNTNPLEKFAAAQEKVNHLLKEGMINQETYNREINRLNAEIFPQAKQEGAGLIEILAGGGMLTALWGKFNEQLSQVKQNLRETRQEAAGAVQANSGQTIGNKQLLEVATGSTDAALQKDYAGLVGTANAVALKYGIPLDKAKGLVYHARNYGNDTPAAIDAIASTFALSEDTDQTSQLVGQFKLNFGAENLNDSQITEMVAAAARHGPSNFGDYGRTFGPASVMASAVGATADETLAVMSAFTAKFGSAETGAKRLNIMLQRIHQHRDALGNVQGLRNNILAMEALEKTNPELVEKDFQSRMETSQAYEALKSPEGKQFIADTLADIQKSRASAGTGTSEIARRQRALEADPLLAADKKLRQSDIQRQIAEQRLAPREAEIEAATNRSKAALLGGGMIGPMRQRAYDFMETVRDWTGYDGSPVTPEGIGFAGIAGGILNNFNPVSLFSPMGAKAIGNTSRAGSKYLDDLDHGPQSKEMQLQTSLLQKAVDLLGELAGRSSRGAARAQAAQKPH